MFKGFDLTGRRALITGADSGIGRSIALGLATHGADLVLHHLDSTADAEQLAEEIRALGRSAECFAQDLVVPGGTEAVAEHAGAIDIVVLNAGVERRKPWTELTNADFVQGTEVNLLANVRLLQLFVPLMQDRGWGRVLSIGSIQQQRPHLDALVYSSTKTAMLHIMRNLARHAAPFGVTLNNLAPGAIRTPKSDERYADTAFRERVIYKIPAAREGRPEDLVGAAILLCSDAGAYITGADLFVDGGRGLFDGS